MDEQLSSLLLGLFYTPHWKFHLLEKIHPTQLGYHWCVATASQEMIRCFPSLRLQVRWKNCWCFAVQMGGFIQHVQTLKTRWLSKVSIFFKIDEIGHHWEATGSHCPDRCLCQAGRSWQCWEVDEANGWRPGMDWNTSSEKRTVEVRLSPRVLLIVELTGIWSMGTVCMHIQYTVYSIRYMFLYKYTDSIILRNCIRAIFSSLLLKFLN